MQSVCPQDGWLDHSYDRGSFSGIQAEVLRVVQMLFGIQMLTGLLVWSGGAALSLLVWEKIADTQMVRRIAYVSRD